MSRDSIREVKRLLREGAGIRADMTLARQVSLSEYRNRPGRGAPILRRVQLTAQFGDAALALQQRRSGGMDGVVAKMQSMGMRHGRTQHEYGIVVGTCLQDDGFSAFFEEHHLARGDRCARVQHAAGKCKPGDLVAHRRSVDPSLADSQADEQVVDALRGRYRARDTVMGANDDMGGAGARNVASLDVATQRRAVGRLRSGVGIRYSG